MGTWLQQFWAGLSGDFVDLPDGAQVGQIVGRMLVAAILGGILGYEREQHGKSAGLRTHMLVALAAAFFVMVSQQAGLSNDGVSRVIQGIAAGIGFLGAGTIIKLSEQGQVLGLTTAAGLYFTTAIGIAAGMGRETSAILGTVLGVIVLTVLPKVEHWFAQGRTQPGPPDVQGPTDHKPSSHQAASPAGEA
jgi:putative Mg2+ transporter-C (MgtC) family protein